MAPMFSPRDLSRGLSGLVTGLRNLIQQVPSNEVLVPRGRFFMGSQTEDACSHEKPVHLVDIPHDYFVDRHLVTNQEFDQYCFKWQKNPYALFAYGTKSVTLIRRGDDPQELEHWGRMQGGVLVESLLDNPHRHQAPEGVLYVVRRVVPDDRVVPEYSSGPDQPVVWVRGVEAMGYAADQKKRLLTEEEWEKAARGPIVILQDVIDEEGRDTILRDPLGWMNGRFENPHILGARVLLAGEELFEAIRSRAEIGVERVFSTPSGAFSDKEIWCEKGEENGTVPVTWGPVSGYGTKQMSGNVWEWTGTPWIPYQQKVDEAQDQRRIQRQERETRRRSRHPQEVLIRRGCGWNNPRSFVRSASRFDGGYSRAEDRAEWLGFRCARSR